MMNLKDLFPSFSKELIADIEKSADVKEVKAGDVLMRKGQYSILRVVRFSKEKLTYSQ